MQVCRLAMLTLLAVFKDLIPAYRIRPATDEAPEQVSCSSAQQTAICRCKFAPHASVELLVPGWCHRALHAALQGGARPAGVRIFSPGLLPRIPEGAAACELHWGRSRCTINAAVAAQELQLCHPLTTRSEYFCLTCACRRSKPAMLDVLLFNRAAWLQSAWQGCWKLRHISTTVLVGRKRVCAATIYGPDLRLSAPPLSHLSG